MKALFVAQAGGRSGWYRCILPAMYSDVVGESWDWVSLFGNPPNLQMQAGWIEKKTLVPDLGAYDVVVLQQVRGPKWRDLIRELQSNGVKVLYEIDDYVHGIRKALDHDFASFFDKESLKQIDMCVRQCNGIIASTQYLVDQYGPKYGKPIFLCENGLDLGRYRLTRPPRGEVNGKETVTIMWAGATGHTLAAEPWLISVAGVMRRVGHTSFVSIGQDFASAFEDAFLGRTLNVPFTSLECYPSAMMTGDVAIAPAGKSDWYRGKSQLRALESMALGIPLVADRHYSETINDGVDGVLVSSPDSAAQKIEWLIRNPDERHRIGDAARERAHAEFGMEHKVGQWRAALEGIVGS